MILATTANTVANLGYNLANTANITATAGLSLANTANTTANLAYYQTNAVYNVANTTFATLNTTFGTINTNITLAYTAANTALNTSYTTDTTSGNNYLLGVGSEGANASINSNSSVYFSGNTLFASNIQTQILGSGSSSSLTYTSGQNGFYGTMSGYSGNGILISAIPTLASDQTGSPAIYRAQAVTSVASYTVPTLYHYTLVGPNIGSGSAITTMSGYYAGTSFAGATNNYGFWGNMGSGTGKWNLYMGGSAANYMAGQLVVGSGTGSLQQIANTGIAATYGSASKVPVITTDPVGRSFTFATTDVLALALLSAVPNWSV